MSESVIEGSEGTGRTVGYQDLEYRFRSGMVKRSAGLNWVWKGYKTLTEKLCRAKQDSSEMEVGIDLRWFAGCTYHVYEDES